MKIFDSILVANRGEIAVRVMRTAKALGYRVIAVYSDADSDALHVQMADEAVAIGPAPATDSYLCIDKIIAAAKSTGAGAIHPGYGFLSENTDFAGACEAAGIVFIGPSAKAIKLMGNKAAAKRRMLSSNVPCIPGFEGENPDDDTLIAAAEGVGFPIMVKAAAGGGGRGMSLVASADKLPSAITSARSVALNSFGSDELILEKAVIRPRHVEVQIFADEQGNTIHLGERDCSVQRRHQKVVEEAPCPVLTPKLRAAMGAAAVAVAKAIDYCGAGTVEFLLDAQGEFYFLEMNTRLQVEHPVTEMITGLDLVALQLKVAQGEPLDIVQDDVMLNGHAIEVRLYAEDTSKGFLPRTGEIEFWQTPDNVRVDAGIKTGQMVTPFYDPMLAKIIVWGEDRAAACQQLIEGLKNTLLFGTTTNRDFLIRILQQEVFQQGQATTAFIEENFSKKDLKVATSPTAVLAMAAAIQYQLDTQSAFVCSANVSAQLLNWSSTGALTTGYRFDGNDYLVTALANDQFMVMAVDIDEEISISLAEMENNSVMVKYGNKQQRVYYFVNRAGDLQLSVDGVYYRFQNELALVEIREAAGGVGSVVAPMHGVVQEVLVKNGEKISKGQRVAVVEAMKMQHDVLAEIDGVLVVVNAKEGQQVEAGQLLAEIE
jgi:geranyl-CoA carboxylase alpha subunit